MKKQIVLLCEGGLQCGIAVPEESVSKIVKRLIADISMILANPKGKQFICLGDYYPSEDPNQEMWIKAKIVVSVAVSTVSNIQVPNKKKLFVPSA